jgi:methionyl-tRNA formyltransferase
MRLVFAGTPSVAVPPLERLVRSGHEVVAVVTRPDAPAGRGRKLQRSPVGEVADAHGIEVLTPAKAGDPEFLARLASLAPDLAPVVAYGGLIPPSALVVPRLGWVNLHFSLLPAWRGAAPVQHAILHGDELTGAAVFQLEEGLDTGPVFACQPVIIGPDQTADDLRADLVDTGTRLLVATLAAGLHAARPQDGEVTYAAKIEPDDLRLAWERPAAELDRVVRLGGAWTTFRGKRLKVVAARPDPAAVAGAPGTIEGDRVATGDGALVLTTVQPEGKGPQPVAAWRNGARLAPGEAFGR